MTDAGRRLAWGTNVRPVVVHVRVDGESTRRRVAARGLERDAWEHANWDAFWAKAGHVTCTWQGAQHLTFDNTGHHPDVEGLFAALTHD